MNNRSDPVQTNSTLQLNLGTFNVPTIAAIVGLGVMVYNAGGRQQLQESDLIMQKARIDAIEASRAQRALEINARFNDLTQATAPIGNLTYRITVAEQGLADVNRRIDRVGDSMQNIRTDINALSTKFEVLNKTIETRLPPIKSEIDDKNLRLPSHSGG